MCGRYRLTAKERYIRDHFGLEDDVSWAPRWNIAPTQQVPIVRQDRKSLRIECAGKAAWTAFSHEHRD